MKSPALRTAGNIAAQRQKSIRSAKKDSMTNITIPPEALQEAWEEYLLDGCGPDAFKAACQTMLKAWPGMHEAKSDRLNCQIIILPLPKENSND